MAFSVRCRYCRCVIVGAADQLGAHEAASIRTHLVTCIPNIGRWPHTIGELLQHLSVSIAGPRSPVGLAPLELVAERAPWQLERRDVLLVHHDEAARSAMNTRLAAEGFSIAVAADAVEALRRLHDGIEPCALVLDADVPRVGGWSLASWLVHHPTYAHLPIVLLTANVPVEIPAARASVSEIVAPVDYPALIAVVERYCGRLR